MNLRALRVFTGLMEDGTLTRASARMNLSQSAASRLLSLLEAELGAPLFARERRRMVALPAAEALYPEALRILSQVEALPGVARGRAAAPLRVLCQTRLVPGLAVPAIAGFARRAGAPVRLEAAPRRELARRVLAGRHDVVLATAPVPVEDGTEHLLCRVPLGILLPKGHRQAGAARLSVEALADTPYIALDETTVIRRVVDAAGGARAEPAVEVSTGSAAYRLVAAGLGYTFADGLAVEPELRDGVALVPWDRSRHVEIAAAVPAGRGGAAAEAFLASLRSVAEPFRA